MPRNFDSEIAAKNEELVALCMVTGEHEGTTLEFIPHVGAFEDKHLELVAKGTEINVYVSDNNAKSFKRSCDGLRNLTITSIAADPLTPKLVLASVAFGGASNGIYASEDSGTSWKKLPANELPPVLKYSSSGPKSFAR